MQQNYQDAMAMVGKFGKPALFLTYTCNPGWREITENLAGCDYQSRPEIVCRVFNAKFKAFLEDVVKKGIFGHSIAYAYVVEFQKRGLPHCHCTFWLADDSQITTVDQLNALICAEIPDPVTNPRLYNIVKRSMIHGPCGVYDQTSACLKDGKCTKHYPKPFCETSILNPNGYSTYRRRDDGRFIQLRNGFRITNQWVVPYNPYLSLKYNCHINIEICSSLDAIKYLYKYMYKGTDSANIVQCRENDGTVNNVLEHNEIKYFMDKRWVSSMEATWRILQLPMHSLSHHVYRLGVHLPNDEPIIVTEPLNPEQIELARLKRTKLKAWFELNRTDPDARRYLYTEIPLHYVWQDKEREWTRRKRGASKVIPRIHNISPRSDQLYFLRLLLLHVPGCQSFEDLRTVNGRLWTTFKEAAIARDLVQDDTEWYNCMQQAVKYQMPAQLRSLFVCINVCQTVKFPDVLLKEFEKFMWEDFARHSTSDAAYHMMLNALSIGFATHEKTMTQIGLPEPDMDIVRAAEALLAREHRIADHLTAEQHAAAAAAHVHMLNDDQRPVYHKIMEDVTQPQRPEAKLHFIHGQGGCGKTFLFMVIFFDIFYVTAVIG